jgi:hypothetical protein
LLQTFDTEHVIQQYMNAPFKKKRSDWGGGGG